MLDWKQKFNSQNIDATLKYLIESDPKKYVVKCGCGCGGVLKCGWPTAEQLEVKNSVSLLIIIIEDDHIKIFH